jgi:hypothetical protein
MQENVAYEDVEFKDLKKADRMLRSESARQRRKEAKQIRETKVVNEWAKARRERKNAKSK